jgi:hypothetical protein
MNDQFEQRNHLQNQLIEKAMKDEVFRNALVTSPKATLEEEFKMKIPESLNIKILEEDANTIYLILPPPLDIGTSDELSESELELVSGGTCGIYDGGQASGTDGSDSATNTLRSQGGGGILQLLN